jgi:hypothetical protein
VIEGKREETEQNSKTIQNIAPIVLLEALVPSIGPYSSIHVHAVVFVLLLLLMLWGVKKP